MKNKKNPVATALVLLSLLMIVVGLILRLMHITPAIATGMMIIGGVSTPLVILFFLVIREK